MTRGLLASTSLPTLVPCPLCLPTGRLAWVCLLALLWPAPSPSHDTVLHLHTAPGANRLPLVRGRGLTVSPTEVDREAATAAGNLALAPTAQTTLSSFSSWGRVTRPVGTRGRVTRVSVAPGVKPSLPCSLVVNVVVLLAFILVFHRRLRLWFFFSSCSRPAPWSLSCCLP